MAKEQKPAGDLLAQFGVTLPSVSAKPKAKKPKAKKPAARPTSRPAPLAALHERYGLVYEPGQEADPLVKDELDALNELYRQRVGRDITDEPDTRVALEQAGFLKPTVSQKRAAGLRRDAGDVFASALDALDAVGEFKPFSAAADVLKSKPVQEPFSSAAGVLGGARAEEAVKSGFEAADRALGKAVGPATTAAATVLAPYTLLATTEPGRMVAGEIARPIGEMLGEVSTTPAGRAIGRLGRAVAPTVRAGLGAVSEGVSKTSSPFPTSRSFAQLSGAGVQGAYPAYEQQTLGDVQAQFERMAAEPERFVPVAATPDMPIPELASEATRAAIGQLHGGMTVPMVQGAYEQAQASPFPPIEDAFYKSRAEKNGFDVSRWDSLTPTEKLYQAYTKNDFVDQTFRSVVRQVGETGSVVAGVKAIVTALANAPADDAAELRMIIEGMLAPYAYAKGVAERDGLSAGLLVAFRDQPVDFALAVSAATRAGGRIGGAAARTGALGERAKAVAQPGRLVTAERPGGPIEVIREEPIETRDPSFMGFVQAEPEIRAREAAVAEGRVSETTGRPFVETIEEVDVPVVVGYTTPNLTSVAGLALKRWVASKSVSYAGRLEGQAAAKATRRLGNVAEGVRIEIQQALQGALGRAPTPLELERAAFELTWAREKINARIVDGELVFDKGTAVTPAVIAAYFRGRAEELRAVKSAKGRRAREAQIAKYEAQEREWNRIDSVRLDPGVVAELRRIARPLGKKNDQLIAVALGITPTEAKRANYIRLLEIDPEFEVVARQLKESVNPITRAAYVDLWRSQRAVERLNRKIAKYARPEGWGKKSGPKSRLAFRRARAELLVALRRAERAATRLGDDALAAQYRAARTEITAARQESAEAAARAAGAVERIRAGEARAGEVPEEAVPAYERLQAATRELREAEGRTAGALEKLRTARGKPARRVPTSRDVALAEQAVADTVDALESARSFATPDPRAVARAETRLASAEERLGALRAASAAAEGLPELRAARALAQKDVDRILKSGRNVLDTRQVRVAIDESGNIAAIELKRAKDYRVFTLDRARGEVLDSFIARMESLDQNALLHLVQAGPIDRIDAPNIIETRRPINLGPKGRVRAGRFKESQGAMFAFGGEATNQMWRNLMFDTAELIAAEGWRQKMREMIELVGVKIVINADAQRRAVAAAKARIDAGETDAPGRPTILEQEVQRVLEADSVEFSLGDFKIMNPLNPTARMPNQVVFRGMVDENIDPKSAAGLLWRELNDRTIDPNAPGEYILVPRAWYNGVQKSLANEAFRFRPREGAVRKVLSGYGLDRATAAWRTLTLNVLPKTAFANIAGSAMLALQGGATPRGFYYAWLALRGKRDRAGRQISVPKELLQRYYANLTIEVGRGGRLSRAPIHVQQGAAWAAQWMNWMRTLNGASEDFNRLAVYYSKAIREARKAAADEEGLGRLDALMLKGRRLTNTAAEMLDDMAADAPEWRAKNQQFIQQSYDFLGDLHRGGRLASVLRIAIPFWQWYVHILKLTFFTMPLKYPGRALMLQQLGEIGQEYQETHGVMIPYGEDLVPLWTNSEDIGGMPQWVTTAVGTSNWYPQGTPAGLGGRTGEASIYPFVRGSVNPAALNLGLILLSIGQGEAYEPNDYKVLAAAKNEYGNEITDLTSADFFNYVMNKLGMVVPLSPTIMSMAGRASTSTFWSPKDKPVEGPALERKRQDVLNLIEDPWGPNALSFLAKAFFGLTLSEVPGIGPVERRRLERLADSYQREYRIQQRNIQKSVLDALEISERAPTRFGAE